MFIGGKSNDASLELRIRVPRWYQQTDSGLGQRSPFALMPLFPDVLIFVGFAIVVVFLVFVVVDIVVSVIIAVVIIIGGYYYY